MGNVNFEFNEIGKLGKSISVQEMKGNDTVYLRLTKLYKDDEGNWHPTKNGVSVPLSEAANLLTMVQTFIKNNGNVSNETDLTSDVNDL